jgi:hypothetical protein
MGGGKGLEANWECWLTVGLRMRMTTFETEVGNLEGQLCLKEPRQPRGITRVRVTTSTYTQTSWGLLDAIVSPRTAAHASALSV